jgi:hypothetical protein
VVERGLSAAWPPRRAGVRSLLYGSAAGVAGCLLLVAAGAHALDVRAPGELRERLSAAAAPLALRLQTGLLPVKARIQVGAPAAARAARACQISTPGDVSCVSVRMSPVC